MSKDLANKIYIVTMFSFSYEGGPCLDCLYSSFDKHEACRKILEYVIEDLADSFYEFVHLYDDYKVISISDPKSFTSAHMIKETDNAKTVAEIMGLDKALYEAIKKRRHMGYHVVEDDPEDNLLQEQIINYLKKVKEYTKIKEEE